jgi:hypothetical protein
MRRSRRASNGAALLGSGRDICRDLSAYSLFEVQDSEHLVSEFIALMQLVNIYIYDICALSSLVSRTVHSTRLC